MDKLSYALGLALGQQAVQLGAKDFNFDDLLAGLKDTIEGKQLKLGLREAQTMLNEHYQKKQMEESKTAREAGEKYLAENAKKDGVVVTKSGLQYQVLKEGTGRKPTAHDRVKCHYEGFLVDGTLFDSSIQRGEPATFGLQQVIAGWTEGLQLMQEGAKYRFVIPYRLGYGENGAAGSIPPYATLIFDVELIEVV